MNQLDYMQILVGRDVGTKSTANATGTQITTYDVLKDGEFCITNSHNVVISPLSILTDDLVAKYGFKFIVRKGTTLLNSDLIKIDNIRSCYGIADSAAAAQLTYIGYNGSSGAIVETDNVPYVPRFILKWQDRTGQGQNNILDGVYKSGTGAIQEDICLGIVHSLDNAFNRQDYPPIVVNAICNVAVATAYVFKHDQDATIVQGSKVITQGTDLTYEETGTSTLVAGDYVRIGTSGSGTALTSSVYKVMSVDSATTYTVDRPVKEASGTYHHGTADIRVISAAQAAAANWGIKCTGQTMQFSPGKFRYKVVTFEVGLNDSFGDTPVTYSTASNKGVGVYSEIAELEWELKGNQGLVYAADYLQPSFTLVADHTATTATYDQIAISYFDDHQTSAVDVSQSAKQLILAAVTGFATTEPFDQLCDALAALGWDMSAIAV